MQQIIIFMTLAIVLPTLFNKYNIELVDVEYGLKDEWRKNKKLQFDKLWLGIYLLFPADKRQPIYHSQKFRLKIKIGQRSS